MITCWMNGISAGSLSDCHCAGCVKMDLGTMLTASSAVSGKCRRD